MKKSLCLFLSVTIFASTLAFSQIEHQDSVKFIEKKNEFYDSVKSTLEKFYSKEKPKKKEISLDFSRFNPPKSPDDFVSYWHYPPVSQAISGMCWCFSTTSFLESEIYRLKKQKIKLSELFTVYWEYVEKARGYVKARGDQEFGEGSESNAVTRIWKKYGIVPAEFYSGLLNGQPFHDHRKMSNEIDSCLKSVKTANAWDEDAVEHTVRAILNHYIGQPPEKITVGNKTMTPLEYLKKVVGLNLDEYVDIVSLADRPYYEWTEYDVDDNWWHSRDYFNVPLDDFMGAIKKSIRNGYTIAIGGDVSEPGINGNAGIAVVPTFDIPSQYIDESARILRFKNGTTEDDHGIHIVGYAEKEGKDWYLIKDSGSGSRNNSHPGYFFFNEDFVKLKMLSFMIPKSAIPEITAKIK